MPDYSKLAKGLTSFVKGVAKPVRTFRTPDGYTFHELPNGKIVDNLDPAKVDMSWPNAKVFQKETGAFQLGDELGQRKAMIESFGKPNLMQDLPGFMNKPTPEDLFQQALNKQNASKPKPIKGGLNEVKKPQEILPAAEREANKQKFMDESADPRRMYHSTANEFNEFLPSGSSRAVFVTPEAEFANYFALDNFTKGGGNQEFMTGTRSMPVRVQVKNPFDYENPQHIENLKQLAKKRFPGNQQVIDEIEALGNFEHNWPSVEHPDVQRLIKQAGHDAFYASERGTKNLGIYDPNRIKSDIGNKGAYDVTKGDINEAKGGFIRKASGGLAVIKRMANGGALSNNNNLTKLQNAAISDTKKPNELGGVVLAGASWMAGDEKTKLAKQLFGEEVTNTAIGGQKTSDVLKQLNEFKGNGGTFAPNTTVVLDIGANDIAQGVDESVIRNNLNEIVSRLGDEGVHVILSGQPEAHSYDEAIKSTNLRMDDLYSDIASNNPNVTLVDAMSGMLNDKTLMDESGFHLNSDEAKLAYLSQFADANKARETNNQSVVDIPQEIAQITQTDKPAERYTPEAQIDFMPAVIESEPSAGYTYAQNNSSIDNYYNVINDYLAQERTQDEIQAAMEQYGVSQADIDAARDYQPSGGKLDESYATAQYAKGGGVRMQVGGLMGLANLGKAGTKLTKAEIAGLRARGMGVPGIDFADPMNPNDIMRMSEALGAAGAEGKTLNLTQADRSRVFGPNKGGTGFSGLQLTSPAHKQAKTTWGVGKPSHVTRMINANTPDTIWSPFIGSPTQHMSNPVTVERMYEAHKNAGPSAELVEKMNKQLNSAIHAKTKKPIFPNGIDISDPASLNQAQTFDQRKAIAQALTIGGEKKGEKATQEAFKIIKEETDPLLMDAPTYAVGNRLFTIDKNTGIYRPDLNSAFPEQTVGTDFGLIFEPAPIQHAAPDFVKKFEGRKNKHGNPQPMGHKDLTATTPKQFIDEAYLTNLQKEGYQDGGSVNQSFTQRLQSAMEHHMADGGEVSDNTTPDMTDSGNVISSQFYAKGGMAQIPVRSLKQLGRQYATGGGVGMNKGGVFGAVAEGVGAVTKALPKVDRLSMNYKDVTKRVPEVSEAAERLFRGEITKQQYNDIVNLYKPVTPYAFVPKPATAEEAIGALRGDAAKSRYGKQAEYEPGTKVGLRLDIPAYTQKGVWVNSIHDQKGKKVAYGPVSSVKNADLGISQAQSKKIAQGGEKQSYARIVGDWNPMTEEEAVAKAQKYLNDPEWRQIGIDPERHAYFYDRATMQPITNADEVIQIGPLVLGKNPKYGKIDDFEYAKGGLSRQYSEAGSVPPLTPQEIEQTAGSQGAAFGVFPQMASQRWQQQSPFADKASEMLKAQVTKEWEQAGRPGGMKELSLRLGAVLAGQTADFANLIQSITPGLNKPATVLDPQGDKVAKFPLTGSTDIKNAMREKGMINEDEYPIAELAGAFGVPYAAIKAPGAIKGGLNMAKPVMREAGNMASRAAIPVQRQFTPATFTVEATAPDLGQGTTYGFRQGLNDVLLENPKIGTGRNKIREAQGTFLNTKNEMELNPMLAIDVPRAGTIGDVPNANKALRQQVGQMGVDLNQEAMAGHRFLPLMSDNIKDASSVLIKTKEGLTPDEVAALAKKLGGNMAVTHNPKLGGVVVFPFGEVKKGQISRELLRAQQAAGELLGKRGQVKFGVSDYNKDRAYMLAGEGDYTRAGAKPMSKEQQAQREKLQGLEKFLFPESRSGIPGQVKAAPVGGLQPWSVGAEYPTSVIGRGNGSRVQYQPVNFSTGKEGARYDKYLEAEAEREKMLDEFHRALVPKYR